MSLTANVALISQSGDVGLDTLAIIAAAVQKQVTRDLARYWQIDATVGAFARLEQVPSDYWCVIVRDDIQSPGAAGIHRARDGQPLALVASSTRIDALSRAISHEVLEMLVDPSLNRVVGGQSLRDAAERVNYLIEICDPVQSPACAYRVNDVLVSDFVTPAFFDPVTNPGTSYSFGGSVTAPRQVLTGGYIAWIDPVTTHLWQATFDGANLQFMDHGPYDADVALRQQSDRLARDWLPGTKIERLRTRRDSHGARQSRARARQLEEFIGALATDEDC